MEGEMQRLIQLRDQSRDIEQYLEKVWTQFEALQEENDSMQLRIYMNVTLTCLVEALRVMANWQAVFKIAHGVKRIQDEQESLEGCLSGGFKSVPMVP
jgi:hypothetical protein